MVRRRGGSAPPAPVRSRENALRHGPDRPRVARAAGAKGGALSTTSACSLDAGGRRWAHGIHAVRARLLPETFVCPGTKAPVVRSTFALPHRAVGRLVTWGQGPPRARCVASPCGQHSCAVRPPLLASARVNSGKSNTYIANVVQRIIGAKRLAKQKPESPQGQGAQPPSRFTPAPKGRRPAWGGPAPDPLPWLRRP